MKERGAPRKVNLKEKGNKANFPLIPFSILQKKLLEKLNYMHENPVRKGLAVQTTD